MVTLLKNKKLELNVYALHVSENIEHAEILLTSKYGDKGETAIAIANVDYKLFNEKIYDFITLEPYMITNHDDYVKVIMEAIRQLQILY